MPIMEAMTVRVGHDSRTILTTKSDENRDKNHLTLTVPKYVYKSWLQL